MSIDPETFRRTMRAWTTGVAIITASHAGETYGMTINSFTSLSLDPPLITVVLQNATHIHQLVSQARTFGVTILSANQRELAEDFAGRAHGPERMAGIHTQPLVTGAPVLTDGLASLDCSVVHTHTTGSNTLFIAEVMDARVVSTDEPLVYHDRGYHQLAK